MGKKIIAGIAVAIVIFLIVAAMQPKDTQFSRSATMNAAPAAVFAEVNDLHQWEAWSPWAKIDPNAKMTYEGPESGVGAIARWSSESNDVGVGSMIIEESRPDELIRTRCDFEKPFPGVCWGEFTFKPEGNQTVVTWTMIAKDRNLMCKAVGLIFNCEKMVGEMRFLESV